VSIARQSLLPAAERDGRSPRKAAGMATRADAAPRTELASGSAVLATARQLGSALGIAAFVAVSGGRAGGLAGLDRAWTVVVITAAIIALAGLATGRRLTGVTEAAANAETAGDAAAA
jgi:hypothetical protein